MMDNNNSINVEERKKKVLEIYATTVSVNNIVNEMGKLDENYFKNNWSVGLSNLSHDLQYILSVMEEVGFSFDYKQAMTFMSYTRIFDYLISKMSDDLTTYDEGIGFVNLIIKNISFAVKPFSAYVCSRVRDLNLENDIPNSLKATYNYYKEEDIDKLKEVDLSNIFEFTFPEDEEVYDDMYIDEVKEEMTKMFGEGYNIEDFTNISEILAEYALKSSDEANIELDF